MLKRFLAVVKARNLEFFRDRASLGWNLAFPVLLVIGFSLIFSGGERAAYKVGVLQTNAPQTLAFSQIKYIDFVDYSDEEKALTKLKQHQIDFIVSDDGKRYWINEISAKGYLVEKLFLGSLSNDQNNNVERLLTQGRAIRYLDWVLPGILGMNMMFSCLFGVGYVIVRYRKNSVLKRLQVTPLTAFEFISAQIVSRLFIVLAVAVFIFSACNLVFDFYMIGNYLDLFVITLLGALCLIACGLLMACRSASEELTGGLLNLVSWPMMFLSGVWFSLEGAPDGVKVFADLLPLTHLVTGARKVMIEGASLADIQYHVACLLVMTALATAIGAYLFKWQGESR